MNYGERKFRYFVVQFGVLDFKTVM